MKLVGLEIPQVRAGLYRSGASLNALQEAFMKQIRLTNSHLFALVDDADYDFLMQWNWQLHSKGYASTSRKLMHRVIINPENGVFLDHRDTNKLNNQRYNIRIATASQNRRNNSKINGFTSKFKGVSWSKRDKIWYAAIFFNEKSHHLGTFISEEKAAHAYNIAALLHFGEFARINDLSPAPGVMP